MYCTIHLLEIIRLSDFSSPLFYPSLLGLTIPKFGVLSFHHLQYIYSVCGTGMRLLLYELLLIKDGFATDLLINRLLMLILSFYLLFYDFF